MPHPFASLLFPGRIGTLELRNRIVMSPMGSNFAEADGHCGDRIQAYYEARAQGGAGLLTMGVCAIAFPAGTAEPFQVGVTRARQPRATWPQVGRYGCLRSPSVRRRR